MAQVFFDTSGVTGIGQWRERRELITRPIRQLGRNRVLYGSNGAIRGNSPESIGFDCGNCH